RRGTGTDERAKAPDERRDGAAAPAERPCLRRAVPGAAAARPHRLCGADRAPELGAGDALRAARADARLRPTRAGAARHPGRTPPGRDERQRARAQSSQDKGGEASMNTIERGSSDTNSNSLRRATREASRFAPAAPSERSGEPTTRRRHGLAPAATP